MRATSASPQHVKITPTPLTAALAGALAALAWPFIWSRYGGAGTEGSVELVVATLLVVALPAHALVVGFSRPPAAGGGVDTALLKRIGTWLAAAVVVALARAAWVG